MSKLVKKQEATHTVELTQTELDLIKGLLARVSYGSFDRLGLEVSEVFKGLGRLSADSPDLVVRHGTKVVSALDVRRPGE